MPQHFVTPPQWEWYIVWYFFLGGLAGGAYVIGALLRLFGTMRDEGAARSAFLISFPAMAICPILLTLDLGRPLRFWHMLIDSRTMQLNFKYWSPMSVGAWILVAFSIFSTLSFVDAMVRDGRLRHPLFRGISSLLSGGFGQLFVLVGALFGLLLAGYTGVLLSVSNQPIWSDTWALGGLFLASGLSVGAAATSIASRWRSDARLSEPKLSRADRYFIMLELVLLVVFFATLGAVTSQLIAGRWLVLWILVLIGTVVPLLMHLRSTIAPSLLAAYLVLIGGLALRIAVIFRAQM